MTRMACDEVRDLLQAHIDEELPADERRAIGQHLAGCPDCAEALAVLETLRTTVKRSGTFPMPDGLEQRLRSAIGLEATRDQRPGWRRYATLAASHLAIAALAGGLALWHQDRTNARDLGLRQIVSAHVRATLTDQPVQIASADSHTVRPWFVGRLPFAPPVRDLAEQGYPLLGGRLDHVLDRTAAALVYARRKHRINVFVLPLAETRNSGLPQGGRDGYAVAAWSDDAFAWFAVSDLNPAELEQFAALLRSPGR